MLYLILFVVLVGYFTNKRNSEPTVYKYLWYEWHTALHARDVMMNLYRTNSDSYLYVDGLEIWQEKVHRFSKVFGPGCTVPSCWCK